MIDLEAIKQHVKKFACFCCTCHEKLEDGAHHPECTTWQLCDDIKELVQEVEKLNLYIQKRQSTTEYEEGFYNGQKTAIESLKNKQVSEHSDKYTDIVSDGGVDPRNAL